MPLFLPVMLHSWSVGLKTLKIKLYPRQHVRKKEGMKQEKVAVCLNNEKDVSAWRGGAMVSALFKVKALKTKMQSCYTNTHTTADCGDGMNGKAAKCKCVSVCECAWTAVKHLHHTQALPPWNAATKERRFHYSLTICVEYVYICVYIKDVEGPKACTGPLRWSSLHLLKVIKLNTRNIMEQLEISS